MTSILRQRVQAMTGPFGPLLIAYGIGLLWLSAVRLALAVAAHGDLAGTPGLWRLAPIGLQMDTVLLCYLLLAPGFLVALLPAGPARDRLVAGWLAASAFLLVYLELATPPFLAEYGKRPDRVFVEYLVYPREVLPTLWASHKLGLIGLPLAAGGAAMLAWRLGRRALAQAPVWTWTRRALTLPVVAALLFAGCRSSLDPRPANISTASFSSNRVANELALNSTYTLAYALNTVRNEADAAALYGAMPAAEVRERVDRYRRPAGRSPVAVAGTPGGTPWQARDRPPNLVIILQESLGAQFVGHLGGLPLTPQLDGLRDEARWFTRMYATGTRTARGIEAVVAGFPPSPSLSVLKLPEARHGFLTLAALLREHGYSTEFIYGGVANFDDMRAFFLGNGFDRVIEQRDFVEPSFVATWGVSDEDLVIRANDEFRRPRDRPFFALLLSSSNHEPFEIPAGRIEPYNQPLHTRENAIRYADHAIGRFFELARRESYFRDTVFLVVADHDARVKGAPLVPLERFRIPALLIGPGVPVGADARVASQIDLAPTLLGLLGIDAPAPLPGRDLLNLPAGDPGRAVMQYGLNHGFLVGDRLVVHQPQQAAQSFRVRADALVPVADDPELTRDALAYALWPDLVYREHAYRLPGNAHEAATGGGRGARTSRKSPAPSTRACAATGCGRP